MKKITKFQLESLKAKNYHKSENGYTESVEYKVNWKNEVVCEYYFNDGKIIEKETVLGIYVER